ncbi:MAG: discoidin domain-containing protein, partial [Coprobacter sp.]|nr:discoidin domain-containing protein [Coprobacter sp.]
TGRYIGANMSYNNPLPMTDTPQNFTLVPITGSIGYFALAPDNRTDLGIHRAGGGDIVHWTTGAEASQWTLTQVNEADYITQREKLAGLLDWAAQLLEQAGTIQPSPAYKMALTENSFYSNATYKGGNIDDFTTWNVLIDNNVDTYFHSRYNNQDSDDGLDHYIRIEAPADETFRHFDFTYITRNAEGASTNITAYKIDGSPDGQTWTDICTASSGLQTGAAKQNSTGEVTAPKGTRFIRFMVTRSGGTAHNHPFFAIAEVALTNRTDDARYTPAEKYPAVTPDDMAALDQKRHDGEETLHSPAATLDDLRQQYDDLRNTYTDLLTKMGIPSRIDQTRDNQEYPAEYYNMQGVPVSRPEHGLYIRRQGQTVTKTPLK